MSLRSIRVLVPICASAALVCACAAHRPAPEPPTGAGVPSDDEHAQVVQAVEALEQSGKSTDEGAQQARKVLDALGGVLEIQGDAGVTGE